MINLSQFREYVIQQPLKAINLYCPGAEELLVATACVESDCGKYLKQTHGPALGPFQMEPVTFYDLWEWVKGSKFYDSVMSSCNFDKAYAPKAEEIVTNLKFASIMARLHYRRFPDPIPEKDDLEGIWKLYKKRWNTSLGATNETEFMLAYHNVKSSVS